MKIRSITYFCNPDWPIDDSKLKQAGKFLVEAKAAFVASGYEVQTVRLATVPFPQILGVDKIGEAPRLAEQMSAAIQSAGIAYAALGPAQPATPTPLAALGLPGLSGAAARSGSDRTR